MGKTTQNPIQQDEEEIVFGSSYPSVPIPYVTLLEFVLKDSKLCPDHAAFVDAATKKSYTRGEVVRDVRRFSKALRSLGLRTAHVVVVHVVVVVLPNVVKYGVVALGIMVSGSVFSGANLASHTFEIKKQVDLAEAKLIVIDDHTYNKAT